MNVKDANPFVERDCLLFESGDYPDRGLKVTIDDLHKIAANSPRNVPVHIEHLNETPFDGAMGCVSNLEVRGDSLWGKLKQPLEAWNFVKRAGARSLSVALDAVNHKLMEVSFVCHPRVASAQVFSVNQPLITGDEMNTVKQFAENLITHLRGVVVKEESSEHAETSDLAEQLVALRAEKLENQIMEFKRRGLMRSAPQAEAMARSILMTGANTTVNFSGEARSYAAVFADFLEANGPVVPMGEAMAADPAAGGDAGDRLVALARAESSKTGVPFVAAFSKVSAQNPDLAAAARG